MNNRFFESYYTVIKQNTENVEKIKEKYKLKKKQEK